MSAADDSQNEPSNTPAVMGSAGLHLETEIDVQVFPWSALLHTGIDIIDQQHEMLVNILNDLASQFVSGRDSSTVVQMIDKLADYAVYHFETEELIWQSELPAAVFDEHQASHQAFRSQIESFRAQSVDAAQLTENLLGYLTEWLAFHILESDRQMAWTVLSMRQGLDYPDARARTETRQRSDDGKLSRVIMALYRRMATTALTLMRSQESSARQRTLTHHAERFEMQQDLLRAQAVGRIGSWKLDLRSQQLEWSPETYRLFGVPPGSSLQLDDFLQNVYAADRDRVVAAWSAALHGEKYDIEHRTANSQGKRWVREVAEFSDWQDGAATTAFGTVQDITEIKQYEQKLQTLAYSDLLTGLPNRHALVDWIESRMTVMMATKQRLCLFVIDLDGLQEINQSIGRSAGDEVLRVIALRLQQASGASFSAHLGSDQFALAYLGCAGSNCQVDRAQVLLALIGNPLELDIATVKLSACIGSVKYEGEDATNAEALLRFAFLALYRAKVNGPNTYEAADFSEHESNIKVRQQIEEVRQGLMRDEFRLFYQPKVDLKTGALIGVEALIRWQHPERGMLGPAEFLPVLEFDAVLIELGDWVINQALDQLSLWQQSGSVIPVSVNVAARQLMHPEFIRKLSAALARYHEVSARSLEIEFLETGPQQDVDSIKPVLQQLRGLGVNASLDDFGTGISSLRVLSALQMQIIKIDRSFVAGMLMRREDLAIVRSALALADSLNCQVIAEGVETESEVNKLMELGCRYIQGYLVARPMPAEQIRPWLLQWQQSPPAWAPWVASTR